MGASNHLIFEVVGALFSAKVVGVAADQLIYIYIYTIGSMYGIYANINGVYSWDPCYYI